MGLVLAATLELYRLAHQSHRNLQNKNTEHQAQHSTARHQQRQRETQRSRCSASHQKITRNSKFGRSPFEQSPRFTTKYGVSNVIAALPGRIFSRSRFIESQHAHQEYMGRRLELSTMHGSFEYAPIADQMVGDLYIS